MRSGCLQALAVLLVVSVGAACTEGGDAPRAGGSPGETAEAPTPDESPPERDQKKPKKDDEPRTVKVPGGATLGDLPDRAFRLCTKGPPLSRACPLLVPVVFPSKYVIDSFGRPGGPFQVLELAAGAPGSNFSRNAPPRVAHVVVESGKPQFLIDLGEPAGEPLPLRRVLGDHLDAPQPVTLDKRWGWKTQLVLAPSFPAGGAHGDHLVYRWKSGGMEHVISLHAWEPAGEAVRTLHAIVRSARSP